MFTGIIESLGKVESLQSVGGDVRLRIQTDLDMSDVHLGDSIATNGICLTVIEWGENWYAADVSRESLNRTTLGQWKVGQAVNVEKAMLPTTRFGGHIVSGHVDGLIEMIRLENIQEKGHLQLNKNIIIDLNDFHELLIKSGKAPAYNAKFFHVLPFISQLRTKGEAGLSDLELCFNFMYGIMALRLKKAEISPETLQTQTEISKFLVLLARNYQLNKNGELDLES